MKCTCKDIKNSMVDMDCPFHGIGRGKMNILYRLENYNPPDRTTEHLRQVAVDIWDAKEEITSLRAEINRLSLEVEQNKITIEAANDLMAFGAATCVKLISEIDRLKGERDEWKLNYQRILKGSVIQDLQDDLSAERTSHEVTKRALELACERLKMWRSEYTSPDYFRSQAKGGK